jgi:hypothetical protein
MIENQANKNIVVDRRVGTLITRPPTYVANEQVVREVAAERQFELFQFHRIIWTFLAFLEIFLAFRFVLRLISANPASGFAVLMYGITGIFTAPFNGLVLSPIINGSILEITTLIAMAVYALLFWAIEYVIRMAADLAFEREFMHSIVRTSQHVTPASYEIVRIPHTTITRERF